MIRPLFLSCGCLTLAVLGFYAITSEEKRADFRYVNPSGIHTLDPARMSWTQDFRVALNIWEGLTASDPKTTAPIAGAALFPPEVSEDRTIYTFTIRDDARWSNGDRVTAGDFIRGWRRSMEPGTATDYTFLFTDHVAGAADYVRWRRATVGALTALARLRDGWGVDAAQAVALAVHPVFKRITESAANSRLIPPADSPDIDGATTAAQLGQLQAPWAELHEELFLGHVAEMDERFDRVGIRPIDDGTLEVRLLRPCSYFLDLTAFPAFLPCHESIERLREGHEGAPITAEGLVVYDPQWTKPDRYRNGYPGLITNGPYRLASWHFKRRARLAVNPFFHAADDIACRTIDMLVFDNISASIMAYEAGDVDFLPAMDVPYDHEIARLASSGERPDFYQCNTLATYFLNFNCASESVAGRPNPFLDPRVRRAFSLAVDRAAIVNRVLQRGDRVATSFVPSGAIEGYDPPRGLGYDPDAARALLAAAGHPQGEGLPPVELLYVPSDERACQAMARMWEDQLNVHVELRCKETKTYAEDKARHRFMVARGNWYADYYDPTTFLDCLATGNGNNDSGYSNPRYDRLLEQAQRATDSAERAKLLREAERIIVEEDCPILPILHYALPIAIKPYVKGLYPNPRLRFPFRYVTMEP